MPSDYLMAERNAIMQLSFDMFIVVLILFGGFWADEKISARKSRRRKPGRKS